MTKSLTLYTNPMSRGRMVRWMLEEVGAAYETVTLEYDTTMKAADYLAINPMGKVPAIKHGDTIVTETAAIIAYLADAFPDAGLAPAPGDRGAYYRWLFFAAGPLEASLTNASLGVEVPAEKQKMAGYGTHALMVDVLEKAVTGRDYIAGDAFTAADVYVGAEIGFAMQFNGIEPRPAFKAYWERLSAREAHKRANALDDALAAGGPSR